MAYNYKKFNNTLSSNLIRNKATDFENMSRLVKPYFDEIGIPLGFAGYKKTLKDYVYSDNFDLDGLFKLTKDLAMWVNYMGEILALTEFLYLKCDNKKRYFESFNISEDNIKAFNELKETQIRHSRLKLYLKHMEIQFKLFKTCFYNVNKTYSESLGSYIYRSCD